jgi:hypothetical protein
LIEMLRNEQNDEMRRNMIMILKWKTSIYLDIQRAVSAVCFRRFESKKCPTSTADRGMSTL